MSRHISRRERWERDGTDRYHSVEGLIVFRYKGQWWAEVTYHLIAAEPAEDVAPTRESHHERLGPFKRPRNAMVEAERHTTMLKNVHGERIEFVPGVAT